MDAPTVRRIRSGVIGIFLFFFNEKESLNWECSGASNKCYCVVLISVRLVRSSLLVPSPCLRKVGVAHRTGVVATKKNSTSTSVLQTLLPITPPSPSLGTGECDICRDPAKNTCRQPHLAVRRALIRKENRKVTPQSYAKVQRARASVLCDESVLRACVLRWYTYS